MKNSVITFFKERGYYNTTLKGDTVLNLYKEDRWDLIELFEEFFTKFNVSGEDTFQIDKYFYKTNLLRLILPNSRRDRNKKPIITINHMIEVAEKGEWFEPMHTRLA